jgi:ribosomal protein S4E
MTAEEKLCKMKLYKIKNTMPIQNPVVQLQTADGCRWCFDLCSKVTYETSNYFPTIFIQIVKAVVILQCL